MIQIQFNNLVLDNFHEWGESADSRIFEHRVPRRQGSIAPQVPAADSRTVSLQGDIWGTSESDLRSKLKTLRNSLAAGRGRLIQYDDGSYLKVVKAKLKQAYRASEAPALHASVSIDFLADDPYWYAAATSSQTDNLTGVSATFLITNNELAPTPVIFEIVRGAGSDRDDVVLTQTTTSLFLKWLGTLVVGQKLIFDCLNRRVIAAGVDSLNAFVPGSIDMMLVPGVNNFAYLGPGNVSVTTIYNEGWL